MVKLISPSSVIFLTFTLMLELSDIGVGQYVATCENWNSPCPDYLMLVRCKRDPCSYSDACPEGVNDVCLSNFCGGCNKVCCSKENMDAKDLVRPCFEDDTKTCSDGNTVKREPLDQCEFPDCITNEVDDQITSCTNDMRGCPDGFTIVSRDPFNECQFFPCPSEVGDKDNEQEEFLLCAMDVRLCPDGKSYVSRDNRNNCEFEVCPGDQDLVICSLDTLKCDEGTYVQRDPSQDCKFFDCPDKYGTACDTDELVCDDLTSVQRNKDKCCIFNPCPQETFAAKLERTLQEMACEASSSGTSAVAVKPSK